VRTVIGETKVVRLVSPGTEIDLVDYFPVARRIHIHVDHRQRIVVLGLGIEAENEQVLLGPIQSFHERRKASFCEGGAIGASPQQSRDKGEQPNQPNASKVSSKHDGTPWYRSHHAPRDGSHHAFIVVITLQG
jgi:hypothetical protein